MQNSVRWILIAVTALAVMASILGGASVVTAATDDCPQQVGGGVLCAGPSLPASIEPSDVQAADGGEQSNTQLGTAPTIPGDGECPIPVGDGVICSGPTIPGTGPVTGQSVTITNWVYLPAVGY